MKNRTATLTAAIAGMAALPLLAGCETSDSGGGGMSNNIMTPPGMETMCVNQAARYANVTAGAVVVLSRIQTGGGPLITLDAAGQKLSCRREANGSVTVFSEFAN